VAISYWNANNANNANASRMGSFSSIRSRVFAWFAFSTERLPALEFTEKTWISAFRGRAELGA
jgi:hypothetical protein